jgi:amino acid adenylation domain-containing protein
MKDLRHLLNRLAELDVSLRLDGESLAIEAPPGVLSQDLLNELRERKPDLMAHLSRREAGRILNRNPIPPAPPSATHPLSFSQRRLWFLDRLEGPSAAYNLSAAFRMSGPLDREALKASLGDLVDRHPMLRMRVVVEAGEVRQAIIPTIPPPLFFHEGVTEDEARSLIRTSADTPFDLTVGPPIRVVLVNTAPEKHLLAVTLAHFVADGWTIGLLSREWSALYNARCAGTALDLPQPAIGYHDFAAWQWQMHAADGYSEVLERWCARLAGVPTILEVSPDRPRAPEQVFAGAVIPLATDAATTAQIKKLAEGTGSTVFMVALAAYAVFLWRYTGAPDLLVGTPLANRNRAETEVVVGLFANILPVRVTLESGMTFRRLVSAVRSEMLTVFADQDVPFDLLVERMAPERDLSRNPLVQTMFAFQNSPANAAGPDLSLEHTVVEPFPLPDGSVRFDLETHLWEEGGCLKGELLFNTALYHDETARRLAADFVGWLARLAAEPDRPIEKTTSLSPEMRELVVEKWNATRVEVPDGLTLATLIERQAAATPAATAVVCGSAHLSYAQLDEQATGLARALAAHGARPGTLVGLLAERSEKTVVALLAILKSGAAYLPLDPTYPAERIGFMLADSGAIAVIADESGRTHAPRTPVVDLTAVGSAPLTPATPDDTAYVIYTSGSTGKPKGVRILQRNIVNFLVSMARKPGMAASDRLVAVTTISFDISALELFLPLIVGGSTIVARREEAMDGTALARLLETSGATIMQATPATWRLLLATGWRGKRGFTALCGGEALSRGLADSLCAGGAVVWNMYGPTETAVWSAIHRVSSGGDEVEPLGRPIANTRIYILDRGREPVPIGALGEIYIGGAGVSPGYLNRPDLDAERFLADPFVPGGRMYQTGDLGRFAADGTLTFAGRVDTQVKLRGFRIELGELEAVISADSQVAACACSVKHTRAGETLVAYIQPQSGRIDEMALRRRVRAWAPDYMNPTCYMVLEAMPRTPNGKIDRNRLPDPILNRDRIGMQPPGNTTEKTIAAAWAAALGVDQISVDTNVFEIGAHSFLALQVHQRLRHELPRPLELVDLFRFPTVASLARRLDEIDAGTGPEMGARPSLEKRKTSLAQQRDRTLKARGIERK